MDSWKALLRPMCKNFGFLKQMELLLESYQRVGMRKNKEGEFTTDRDPTRGVFETKTNFQGSFQISYLFQQRYRDIISKEKMLCQK